MTSPKHDVLVHPGARFVTDFSRLITDIDRLMVDIGDGIESRSTKSNGHAHKTNLDGTISTLREHAHSFLKSLRHAPTLAPDHNGTRPKRDEASPRIDDLVVHLSRAQNLTSTAEAVGKYCRKAFHSPAGMIFLERDGDLQLLFEWQSRQFGKPISVDLAKNGPAARVFRTGEPAFFNHGGPPRSNLSRCIHRALRRCHARSLAFLPLSADERIIGVLSVLLPQLKESEPQASDQLLRVGPVISGWIERARAYEDAVAARNRIQHAMQVKDEFLSMLSHELRNPMMPILGWAVALSSGPLPADKQNLALEGIVRNVRALNYLIEDLFDAVRISSGKLRLQPATTRIQEVAREALAAIQPSAENKKLRISTDISEGIPPFLADSRRLHQVLMNLLNNAVKFTPPGGSIALRIRRQANSVECIVSDSGKGIERKFLPFVFDRLRQGNRSWKDHAAGLGLGLAIVREIVELHGGSIQALSNGSDKGSTFIFRLPLRRKTNGRLVKIPAKSDPRLRKNNSAVTE